MTKMVRNFLFLMMLLMVFSFTSCGLKESGKASDVAAVSKETKEEKEESKKEKKKEKKEKKDKKESNKAEEKETEETKELVTEEETEEEIGGSEGEIRIVVSFKGEETSDLSLTAVLRPNGPEGTEMSTSSDDGKLTMSLNDLSADYDFHLYMGESPEASAELFNYDVKVKVYLPDSKEAVTYELCDHMDLIYQDSGGMVLWGPFGISHGELTDYDPSWIFMA